MMMNDNQLRVEAGIKLLDEKRPGWVDDIDVEGLYIDCPFRCVLGQVFSTYDTGLRLLGPLAYEDTVKYGFTAEDNDWYEFDMEELTEIWQRRVKELQET